MHDYHFSNNLISRKNDEGKEQRGMKKLSTNAAKNDEIETSTTAVRRETSKLDDSKNRWNSKELESLIKGIENCILAKRELEANNLIQSIKQMIESSSYINPEYLLNMADINIRICLPIRALILLTCASRLYQNGLNPDERVERIGDCSYKAFIAISGMSIQGGRIRDITQTFAMQTCQDILKDLKSVKNANTNIKTVQEVRCLNNVGRSYGAMGYHPEEIEFYNNGIKLMELKFGSEATKYRIMGDLRNNTGVALAQLGKYLQAENSFTKAFAAFKDSEDLYERKREELIYRTTNNLKHMRDASNQYVYITR